MGNQTTNKEQANAEGHKVVLSLRCRDIILHYPFKMKVLITDISLFPHGLQGLKLWDVDIVLSRFIILENEKFINKSAFVFKGGVGILGVTLSKWGGCKKIDMCDTRHQVVGNMIKNCQRNQVKNVNCFEVNLAEFGKYTEKYDFVLATDLLSEGFQPQVILNIWRKVLKVGGQGIMVLPDKKDQAKKLLQIVDRSEFKIVNVILTAQQYEASPLLNKLEGEAQFPQIGKTNFYVIMLTKLKEKVVQSKKQQPAEKQSKQANNLPKEEEKKSEAKVQNVEKQKPTVQSPAVVPNGQAIIQKLEQQPIKNIQPQKLKQQDIPVNQLQKKQVDVQKQQDNEQKVEQKHEQAKSIEQIKNQQIVQESKQVEQDLQDKKPDSQGL